MILVADVFSEVQRVMGAVDDATVYNRISDAVELLCSKTEVDPLLGWVDINTGGSRAITLPREVDTVLSLNISGVPSFPRNRWAEFHLNGRGSDTSSSSSYFWDDKGDAPIFIDPTEPVQLSAVSTDATDVSSCELWVYGYGPDDRRVTSVVGGNTVDGYKVVVSLTQTTPLSSVPFFKRITEVRKTSSKAFVSLYASNEDATTYLIGEYEPSETLPKYRRIYLSQDACWVRIQFRRKILRVSAQSDRVPIHSRYALMLMCKALQKYDDDKIDEGMKYEEKAVKLLIEKQQASNPVVSPSIQMNGEGTLIDQNDRLT